MFLPLWHVKIKPLKSLHLTISFHFRVTGLHCCSALLVKGGQLFQRDHAPLSFMWPQRAFLCFHEEETWNLGTIQFSSELHRVTCRPGEERSRKWQPPDRHVAATGSIGVCSGFRKVTSWLKSLVFPGCLRTAAFTLRKPQHGLGPSLEACGVWVWPRAQNPVSDS